LGLERFDLLDRVEAERALWSAVKLRIAMGVTLDPRAQHASAHHGSLRHAALRDVDLDDAPRHPSSVEHEDALAGRLRIEEPVGVGGLGELEAMREKPLERHPTFDDELRALLLDQRAEGPRGVERQLAAEEVPADVEGNLVSLADEADPAPCPSRTDGRETSVGVPGTVERGIRSLPVGEGLQRVGHLLRPALDASI